MSLRLALISISAFVVLGLAGALYVQTMRLESTQRQLVEARQELAAARRAIVVLEDEMKRAIERAEARAQEREAILAAPETENRPISPILRRGLQGADNIGGPK